MNWIHDRRRTAVAALTVLFSLAALVVPLPLSAFAAPAPQTREITIDARAFAYAPASIEIHRGDIVNLTLEAMDAAHGLSIDGYDINLQAEPGQSAHATFVADKAGRFKFRCSISCGPLHPFMIGELKVDPALPLGRALAAMLFATLGALAFFWRGP